VGQSIAASALLYRAWAEVMREISGITVYRVTSTDRPEDVYGNWLTIVISSSAPFNNYRSYAGLPNSNTGQYLTVGNLYNPEGCIFDRAKKLYWWQVEGWLEVYVPDPVNQHVRVIITTKLSNPY